MSDGNHSKKPGMPMLMYVGWQRLPIKPPSPHRRHNTCANSTCALCFALQCLRDAVAGEAGCIKLTDRGKVHVAQHVPPTTTRGGIANELATTCRTFGEVVIYHNIVM